MVTEFGNECFLEGSRAMLPSGRSAEYLFLNWPPLRLFE